MHKFWHTKEYKGIHGYTNKGHGLLMRLAFIIFMGLFILVGAGAGYFMFIDKSYAASSVAKNLDKDAKAAEKEILYVQLDPLIFPIISHNGISQTVSIIVKLEVDDETAMSNVSSSKPRLTDAFISDMYGSLSRQASLHGGTVKASTLKRRLERVSKKLMGEGVISDVVLKIVHNKKV